MTYIYLAVGTFGFDALDEWAWAEGGPNLLIAYPYLNAFRTALARWSPPRTMLDSGAFSAWQSGHVIDLEALARDSKNPRWTETVGLDVIGSWEGSKANAIKFKMLGSPAMPVFHIGDPWELLEFYCAHWPKVGLSCRFGEPVPESMRFYEQCFAQAWPHRFHSFGWTDERMLLVFPFHSADSSTWASVAMYGESIWGSSMLGRAMQRAKLPGVPSPTRRRAVTKHIRCYLDLQERLRWRWTDLLSPLGDYP